MSHTGHLRKATHYETLMVLHTIWMNVLLYDDKIKEIGRELGLEIKSIRNDRIIATLVGDENTIIKIENI